jgi:hypothetical protein
MWVYPLILTITGLCPLIEDVLMTYSGDRLPFLGTRSLTSGPSGLEVGTSDMFCGCHALVIPSQHFSLAGWLIIVDEIGSFISEFSAKLYTSIPCLNTIQTSGLDLFPVMSCYQLDVSVLIMSLSLYWENSSFSPLDVKKIILRTYVRKSIFNTHSCMLYSLGLPTELVDDSTVSVSIHMSRIKNYLPVSRVPWFIGNFLSIFSC